VTALYVTHDQQEAFAVGDRIVVMDRGRIEQVGRPEDVYFQPNSVFVARFLGLRNLLPATVVPDNPDQVHTSLGLFALGRTAAPGQYVLLIRPEAVNLVGETDVGANRLEATLQVCSFRGSHYHVEMLATARDRTERGQDEENSWRLVFELPSRRWSEPDNRLPSVGQPVHLTVDASRIQLLTG
jgi:ABC-type Fe3+/spermidine/putrescine transport system ATPase subunit